MAELDQHLPTTSSFHRPTMGDAVVKMKRIQRFTRQLSIFVHSEEEKQKILARAKAAQAAQKKGENDEDHLFKYPGDLRAIKRKRIVPTESAKNASIGAKRKMMAHQKSIREGDEEGPSEISKDDNKEAEKVDEEEEEEEEEK